MANSIFRTSTLRVENAASFVRQFYPLGGSLALDNHLYALIGQEDNPVGINPSTGANYLTGAGIWSNDSVPPLPSDSNFQDQLTWSTAVGGTLVPPQQIALVVPNRPTTSWTPGTVYDAFDNANANLFSLNFYAYNDSNEVFVLVANPSNAASVTKPVWYTTYANVATRSTLKVDGVAGSQYFGDGTQSIVTTSEGCVWKYMYTMTTTEISTLLQQYWLPVNYGNNRWLTQSDPQYTQSQDGQGPYGFAYRIMGAKYALINVTLVSGAVGSGLLPSGIKYRQVAFVENPTVLGSATRASFSVGVQPNTMVPAGGANQFSLNSGLVIYVENDSPIFTQTDQTQEIQVVIAF